MEPMELCEKLAATAPAEYDCRRCGACCLSPDGSDGYVILQGNEPERLRLLGLPLVSDGGGQTCLGTRPREGRDGMACVAFEGAVGWTCGCTVYEERPERCRRFEVGSAHCRFARLLAGLPL